MSAKLIKAGEPFNFSAFNFQNRSGADRAFSSGAAAAPAPVSAPPPTAPKISHDEKAPADVLPNAPEILQAAQAEARRLIADAESRAAEIQRAARERGQAEAQALAQAELHQAAEELRAQLAASLDELAGLRTEIAARTEQDLVRLALEIAKKIVHREVKVDHEIALTLARVALSRIHGRASAIVRLHPDDCAYVRDRCERLGTESAVEIVEDRSINPGGCIVQSELGEIDARIEQQFAEIEKNFI
ncbi:MAG TPA: FliH/SctL family protein [Blastocatellia bacterium]|nr:FliH/SctL family protein [Blastocatellia bacterium]